MRHRAALVPIVVMATWVVVTASEPAVQILAPAQDSYVAGELVVRAAIEPQGARVESVRFFGDGRLVCTVSRPPFECAWDAGPDIRQHDIRVVAVFTGGRRAVASVTTKGARFADTVDVDRVQVTAVVTDGRRYVRGLKRSDFRLYENGARVPIEHFSAEEAPLEVAVGVDISESMTGAIGQTKEFVKRFLSQLRETDRVTVLAFNENQFLIARPSVDLAARVAAVDALAPWGATALHDVIVRSFRTLGRQQGRRALVVFTDGEDTASRVSAQAVERRTESSDAVLFMIGQGQAVESEALRSLCERLARSSGGQAFFPRRIEDLGEVFDRIAEELSNQYLMTFAPSARRDGAYQEVRVEVAGGHEVRARRGYRLEPRRSR